MSDQPSSPQSGNSTRSSSRNRRGGKKPHAGPLHIDEKWLVSYSDMMTLLFGLFVMLYSIAMEKQGDPAAIRNALKAISSEVQDKRSPDSVSSSDTSPTESNSLAQAQSEIEKLSSRLSSEKAEKERIAQEKEKLAAEMAALEKQVSETVEQGKEQTAKLETDLEASKEEAKKLQRDLAVASSQEKIVLLTAHWEQERYDIDLELISPDGLTFNFKQKSHGKLKTAFISDAARGPGTEVIRIDSAAKGKYLAKVRVYNSRGAKENVKIKLALMTPFGEVLLPAIALDGKKVRESQVAFFLEKSGKAKVLGAPTAMAEEPATDELAPSKQSTNSTPAP